MHLFLSLHSVLHYTTFACIRKVFNGCVKDALNQTEAAAQLARSVNENVFCIEGPFEILANPRRIVPFVSLTCNNAYDQGVPVCGKILQQMFVANRADTSLCRLVYRVFLICQSISQSVSPSVSQ